MSTRISRKMAVRFPAGTRVVATSGPALNPADVKRGTLQGTVVRFVEGNNAQGGYATVKWDNGTVGRKSPGCLAVVDI